MRNSDAGHCAPLGSDSTENDKSRVLDVSNSFMVWYSMKNRNETK